MIAQRIMFVPRSERHAWSFGRIQSYDEESIISDEKSIISDQTRHTCLYHTRCTQERAACLVVWSHTVMYDTDMYDEYGQI